MSLVLPNKIDPIVRNDGIAERTMRAWMESIHEEVDSRFVVANEWRIRTVSDFKKAGAVFNGDAIHIPNDTSLAIKGRLDLNGYRLIMLGNCQITGTGKDVSHIYSNLSSGSMIYSESILDISNITLLTEPNAYCVEVDGTSNPNAVIDWILVNFNGGKAGKFTNLNNANGVLIGILFGASNGFEFYGSHGTVAFAESIFQQSGSGKTAIKFDSGVTINRRIRMNFCAFVVNSSAVGIDVPTGITIPDDTYILFFCNFSGSGTYKSGFINTDVKSRHIENRGIPNTYRAAACGFEANTTATTISGIGTYVKIAGTTTADSYNSGFSHSSNRLTKTTPIASLHRINFSANFTGTTGNVIGARIYLNGTTPVGVAAKSTANAAGRAENVTGFCDVFMSQNDYIEVWGVNLSAIANFTAEDLYIKVTE